jgi:hypothetical protein
MKSLKRILILGSLTVLAAGGVFWACGSDSSPAPANEATAANGAQQEAGQAFEEAFSAAQQGVQNALTVPVQSGTLECTGTSCAFEDWLTTNGGSVNGDINFSGTNSANVDLSIAFNTTLDCTISISGGLNTSGGTLKWETSETCTRAGVEIGGSSCTTVLAETDVDDDCTKCTLPGGTWDSCATADDDDDDDDVADVYAHCQDETANSCETVACSYEQSYKDCLSNGGTASACEFYISCAQEWVDCICPNGTYTTDSTQISSCANEATSCFQAAQ